MTSPMSDTKPHRFTITCVEPGCNNHIHYTDKDKEVPLYCEKHRTEEGRHAGVRELKPRIPDSQVTVVKPAKTVVMRCPVCKSRRTIREENYVKDPKNINCICGVKMIYHKDTKGECSDVLP